jgi:hypothetical protein
MVRAKILFSSLILVTAMASAKAQVPLSSYVDANGFIDVQKLTCGQLAGTFQEDADALTALVQRVVQWSCQKACSGPSQGQGHGARGYRLL